MKFDLDYLEKIANLLEEKSLAEIELHDGGQSVSMKRMVGEFIPALQKEKLKTPIEDTPSNQETEETESKTRKSIVCSHSIFPLFKVSP